MKDADHPAIRSFELVASEPLVAPDGLQEALGGRLISLAQNIPRAKTGAPGGIEIFRRRRQLALLLRRRLSKVKSALKISHAVSGKSAGQAKGSVEFLLAETGIFWLNLAPHFDE
jgi:hypothetical protein